MPARASCVPRIVRGAWKSALEPMRVLLRAQPARDGAVGGCNAYRCRGAWPRVSPAPIRHKRSSLAVCHELPSLSLGSFVLVMLNPEAQAGPCA
jgi:hypothetical protein